MNDESIDSQDEAFRLLDMLPGGFIVDLITGLVFIVSITVCWRVLSKKPKFEKLGRGFGFILLSFLIPAIIGMLWFVLEADEDSPALYWLSEGLFVVMMLLGAYNLVSGSRELDAADDDVNRPDAPSD